MNECQYPNVKKPWRVDNTCKAELDDVALKLQQDPDAKLVVVGNADPKEKRKNLAGERALNVKAYISGGEAKQNIDASRIEARTGNAGTMTTEQWIVPAGATFPEAGTTTPVDETKVKAVPDHPKPVAKKKRRKRPNNRYVGRSTKGRWGSPLPAFLFVCPSVTLSQRVLACLIWGAGEYCSQGSIYAHGIHRETERSPHQFVASRCQSF